MLQLPFFSVHPCKTRDIMQEIRAADAQPSSNPPPARPYLITWLSVVSNLLPLPNVHVT